MAQAVRPSLPRGEAITPSGGAASPQTLNSHHVRELMPVAHSGAPASAILRQLFPSTLPSTTLRLHSRPMRLPEVREGV